MRRIYQLTARVARNPCKPTRDFSARLCHSSYPGAALFLFQQKSPWQRRWVKAKGLEGKNGEGGPSGGELAYAEEVLLMAYDEPAPDTDAAKGKSKHKKADADIVVLRWDGTCASVKASDTATFQPGAQKHAIVDYTAIDSSVQRSLLRDTDIEGAVKQRQGACAAGASAECDKAHQDLSSLIVTKIRRGTKLSMPDNRP